MQLLRRQEQQISAIYHRDRFLHPWRRDRVSCFRRSVRQCFSPASLDTRGEAGKPFTADVVDEIPTFDRREACTHALMDCCLFFGRQVAKDSIRCGPCQPGLARLLLLHAPDRSPDNFADVRIASRLHLAADELRHLRRHRDIHLFHRHNEDAPLHVLSPF
ncbi:hypothetical protein SBA4_770004 [Candidatus Sulfopaludibacter sp. SbA4]|nr:hypothetical protein SBA4_770004 [Candidatus Sulfopaludibacter sp. SbA4]